MEKTENSQPGTASLLDESYSSFIEVFYRIFKIGIYYPVGHVAIDNSAEIFIKKMRDTFPARRTISLEFTVAGLFVEKRLVSEKTVPVRELYQLMTRLGVQTIEFERTISHKHFLRFVKSLLSWRAELDANKSFMSFNVTNLPSTIRVSYEKYVIDGSSLEAEDPESEFSQSLEEMYEALVDQGFTETQVDGCKELMKTLSTLSLGDKVDINSFPNATWKDVQSLLVKSVTRPSVVDGTHANMIVHGDINALVSIFVSLEKGLIDQKSKETIRFLIAHLTVENTSQEDTIPESSSSSVGGRPVVKADSFEITTVEIKSFVQKNRVSLKVLEKMVFADRSEELSIVLQLLHTSQNRKVLKKCREIVKNVLLSQVTAKEWEIVFLGIKHIAESGNIKRFRALLNMIILTLRESEEVNSKEFIVIFWKKMPKGMHVLLWPFAVNELLYLGFEKDIETFYELSKIVCHMPVDVMKQLWRQLEAMDVVEEKKVASVFFRPAFLYSYQLFAFLLSTPLGDIIGPKILAALKSEPQDDFLKAVVPVLQDSNLVHQEFLRIYLSQAPFKEVPLGLKMGAGKIVLEFLENISDAARDESWLPRTLEATPSLQAKGIKEMLERVVEERKMKIIPVWSKSCRRAAESALQVLKRQKLSHLL